MLQAGFDESFFLIDFNLGISFVFFLQVDEKKFGVDFAMPGCGEKRQTCG